MPLILSGSVNVSGSMTATTILVSSPGAAGMVSSSAQITELIPLMQSTASLQTFTASQDNRNFTLSQVTASFAGEIGGLEAYSASLKAAGIVSSSTQIQNYDVFALNSVLYIATGSIKGEIAGIEAYTASLKGQAIVSSSTQVQNYDLFALNSVLYIATGSIKDEIAGIESYTASLKSAAIVSSSTQIQNYDVFALNSNLYNGTGSIKGEIAGIESYTASLKTAAIVSSSTQVQNYNTFARTGSANTFYGSQNLIGDLTQQTSLNSTAQFFLILRKSRGTIDTPLTVNVNDEAGGIMFSGYDGTTWRSGAAIRAKIASVSPGSLASDLAFFTGNGSPSAGTTRLTIDSSGNIGAPTGTNIYNASDARLKKNISSISGSLNSVLALNPVKFNWIDNFVPSESGKDMLGFIAQEIQTIVPEAVDSFVSGSIFVGETEIDNPLRVNEKFLIPVLTKAIQEQQAIIDGLIARIEALENN